MNRRLAKFSMKAVEPAYDFVCEIEGFVVKFANGDRSLPFYLIFLCMGWKLRVGTQEDR